MLRGMNCHFRFQRSQHHSPRTAKLTLWVSIVLSSLLPIAGAYADTATGGHTPVTVESQGNEIDEAISSFQSRVQMRTLPNGLRVIFYKRGVAPVFAGAVIVRVGGSDELPGHTGIAHMFEHMAFKGSSTIGTLDYRREKPLLEELERLAVGTNGGTELTGEQKARWSQITEELQTLWQKDAFTREYEKRGASGMNATTSSELTSYFVSLPTVSFDFWAAMEAARIGDPVMRQFYQERDVVMEERRTRTDDSGDGRLYEQLLQTAFTTHPYRNPVIGYPQDINRVTATDVQQFRKRFYVPENMVVAVVGNLDAEQVFSTVGKYFGRIPAGKVRRNVIPVEPPQTASRQALVQFPAEPQAVVAYHKPSYPHADAIPIVVANEILTGGTTSILFRELIEKQQILSSIDAFEAPGTSQPNLWIFSLTPRAPHTNAESVAAFKEVIATITKEQIAAQLEAARRALTVGQIAGLRSNSAVAIELASTELLFGSWRAGIDQLAELKQVTADMVTDAIHRYLVESNETVGFLERAQVEPLDHR